MSSLLPVIAPYVPPTLIRTVLADPTIAATPAAERFPAAVLLADISGFTPLAEALAQEGLEGPEELTRLLNRYFSRMIALIEDQGGEVAQFSGDAVTVLFPATDEPLGQATRRAKQTAEAMQATMAEFNSLPTSAGPVALGLKIGVGAGEVLAMQVGGVLDRWAYVIAGDPLRQVAEAEIQARQGEIRLSPEAQANVRGDLIPPPPRALTHPDWATIQVPATVEARLRRYLPGAVSNWLEKELRQWLAVLRPMSVLFIGLRGLDYAQAGAMDRLHRLLRAAQETIYRYEGSINKLTVDDKGSVLLALFGAPPLAHADDPLRAVRCALDLQTVTVDLPERAAPASLAIGIATGRVFAGPVGSETRREYTVLGDTVNLAARLMGQAGPGGILCDFDTYRQVQDQIAFESLPPVRVKGKAGLIRVYRPTAQPSAVREQVAAHSTPTGQALIGRKAEIARLEAALDAIEAGESRVLIVEGEAGIGKSRLVGELTRLLRERGLAWLLGTGQSIEQQTPYRAWRDVFSFYFGLNEVTDPATGRARHTLPERRARVQNLVQEIAPEQRPRLPLLNDVLNLDLPDTDLTATLDPALRQQSLVSLLLGLLRAWASERPLILVLEDVHWLDSLSWELVVQAARALVASDDPLLLVLVTRPLDESAIGTRHLTALKTLAETETLTLTTLSPGETVQLVTNRLGLPEQGLPAPIAELVRQRAGGNPFFAEELIFTLRDQGIIRILPPAGEGKAPKGQDGHCLISGDLTQAAQTLPDTVQGLILARIDRLPPERQLPLKVGAVIGRSFAYSTLRYTLEQHAAISDAGLQAHLDALAALDLTPLDTPAPNLTYTFKHIITQEVAYQTLLFAQRRALHKTVAEWYEITFGKDREKGKKAASALPSSPSLSPYLPLLVHHYHHAQETERERHYATLAGEQAAAQFANAEAVTYYSRALDLTASDALAERYFLLLAREKVHDLQGEREAQARDLVALGTLAHALDDGSKPDYAGVPYQAEVALRQANYAEAIGNYPAAITAAQSAIDLARLTQTAQHKKAHRALNAEAMGYLQWGRALWRQGDYETARGRLEQALALAQSVKIPQARAIEADSLRNLGAVSLYQGDYARAKVHYEQALHIFREIGDRQGESGVLNNLGAVSGEQGDYGGARAYFERALRIFREIGHRQDEGKALMNLGLVSSLQGDYSGVKIYFEQALRIQREVGDRQTESMVFNNLGNVAEDQSDYIGARAYYEQALRISREIGDRRGEGRGLVHLGLLFHHLGDYGGARSYYEQALRIFREIGYRQGESETLAHLGLLHHHLGDNETAQEHSQSALRIAAELGNRRLQGSALTNLGRAQAGLGRWVEATDAYQRALDLRRELGQSKLALDSLAGLARISLSQGDLTQAQAHIDEILSYLEAKSLTGTKEPFRVYLTCYRVLAANRDPRAPAILNTAHSLLQERAAKIRDEGLRRIFLENAAAHREVESEWRAFEKVNEKKLEK
jgi:class 3 adenylate cyclase/tetratricopeptide (TPR) repeat protein